jgi:hypothetical protein
MVHIPKRKRDQIFLSGPNILVRLAGIEPTTPWFVAKYSIQLSYSRDRKEYISFGENGKAASLRHGWNTEHFGAVPVEVAKNTRLRWRNRFLTLTKNRPSGRQVRIRTSDTLLRAAIDVLNT